MDAVWTLMTPIDDLSRQELRLAIGDHVSWSSDNQRALFVAEVEESIAIYTQLTAPLAEGRKAKLDKLDDVARSGQAFFKAVSKLDKATAELLELGFIGLLRGDGDDPQGSIETSSRAVLAASDVGVQAGRIADAAGHAFRTVKRLTKWRAIDSLIIDWGRSYYRAFGELPGSSAKSCFANLMPSLLRAAGIDDTVGEDRLVRLLTRARPDGKGPRRGRKPQAK
ncbi:hypothetical protein [Mesorhizobium sp. CN2-181]|uniref:hypothetical protein n=1 Tax=Mesorhizobium yinganensis TaxID=3157707 RepID=UPI0032B76CC8